MNAERDRDRLLEDALKHQLRAAGTTPATDSCLDAETLAAWMDGGLDPQAIAMAEAHASSCARCQALLGSMAQTTPAAPAAEPHGARLWRWWFAPLAASAAAATLWMVVPQRPLVAPASAPPVTAPPAASAPAESAQAESAQAKSEPAPPAVTPSAAPSERLAVGKERADAAPPAPAGARRNRDAQSVEGAQPKAEAPRLADNAATDRAAEGRVAAAPPAAPAVALRKQADTAADAQATARSAPTPNVIWLVGRAGLVQLATDGRTFVRVPFPESVDLTAVTATDDRRAVVTTADGRVFETADAGATWQRRP